MEKENVNEFELADKESLYRNFAGQIIMKDNLNGKLEDYS